MNKENFNNYNATIEAQKSSAITEPQANEIKELNLEKLSNQALATGLENLVRSERKITHLILLHINEVETRRLYLDLGFASMYDYLTKGLLYSESSAYRRLQSARLLKQLPEISQKLELGSLNLSQLAQVQTALRQEKKQLSETFGSQSFDLKDKAKEVIGKLENKSQKQSEVILAQEFNFAIAAQEKQRHQKDESLKLELTFSKDEAQLLEKVKALMSHQNPSQQWKEMILVLAKKELKKWEKSVPMVKEEKTKEKEKAVKNQGATTDSKAAVTPATAKENSACTQRSASPLSSFEDLSDRSDRTNLNSSKKNSQIANSGDNAKNKKIRNKISVKLKRELFNKADFRCQHVHSQTHQRCVSKCFLEVEHEMPLTKGGSNEAENLRIYCRTHNAESARAWGLM